MKPLAANWPRIATPGVDGAARIEPRQIYILPSKYGLMFMLLVIICLIGAVNYGNNPAFLLTFLLAGLGVNAIYQTWRNLHAVQVRSMRAEPVFAGTDATFRFMLLNGRAASRPALQLQWRHSDALPAVVDLPAGGRAELSLTAPTERRGYLSAATVVLSTRYPLGLLRAWCYIDTNARCLVYPCPARIWQPPPRPGAEGELAGDRGQGTEDFHGLRGYRPGDAPSHLHWKALAREQGLQTKLFGGDQAPRLWLAWEQTEGMDDERRLSQLCRGLLDAESSGNNYGLRMPAGELRPDRGEEHLHRCLAMLAQHGGR